MRQLGAGRNVNAGMQKQDDEPMSDEEIKLLEQLRGKAKAGDLEAEYEIGWRSAIGMGLPEDQELAVESLRKAAEQGHLLAQNNLGARYVSGEGVPLDLIEAYKWFAVAAAQGDRKAGKNKESVAAQLSAEQLAQAEKRLKDRSGSGGFNGAERRP